MVTRIRCGSRPRAATWVALVCLTTSCESPLTQLVVETDSDYTPVSEITRVEWTLRSNDDQEDLSLDITADTEWPITFSVVPAAAEDANLDIEVRAFLNETALVTQQVRTSFLPEASTVVRIELSRRCQDVVCGAEQTCRVSEDRGACATSDVPATSLPVFVPGESPASTELCNERDDDGDGAVDEDFAFDDDARHCGGCFVDCPGEPSESGRPVCDGGSCSFECTGLNADCDGSANSGCETALVTPTNCGGCGVTCPADFPLCDEDAGSASCVDGCTGGELICAGSCVDTATDQTHCGECDNACESVGRNGSNECVDGICMPLCNAGFHLCDGQCADDTALATCGSRCEPCPTTGPQVVAGSCSDRACVLECEAGFVDCNGESSDGCEVSLTGSDPQNCGGCGIDCGYGTCAGGACSTSVNNFAVGSRNSCAVLVDGTLWCWGDNRDGQSSVTSDAPTIPEPGFLASDVIGFSVTAPIHLDERTGYVIRNSFDGPFDVSRVLQWGRDPTVPPADATTATSVQTRASAFIVYDFAVGGGSAIYQSAADFMQNSRVSGFGNAAFDAFSFLAPDAARDGYIAPTDLFRGTSTSVTTRTLARGDRVTCMRNFPDDLGINRGISCWGTGDAENPAYVGNGMNTGTAEPFLVGTGSTFDVGTRAGCVDRSTPVAPGGTPETFLHCWGEWACGPFTARPQRVPDVPESRLLSSLSVGAGFACAVTDTFGAVLCWGTDVRSGECYAEAQRVFESFPNITRIALADTHGCFTRDVNGASILYCFGSNEHSQIGDGGTAPAMVPRQVVFRDAPPD